MDLLALAVLGIGAWYLLSARNGSTGSLGAFLGTGVSSPLMTAQPTLQAAPAAPASRPTPSSSSFPTTSVIGAGVGVGSEIGAAALGATGLAAAALTAGFTAGAGVLIWGIADKGWFRGGEEGVQVNPARDSFLAQFGPSGTGEGTGFARLAAALTQITGEPNGSHYFAALTSAHAMDEFTAAVQAIGNVLAGAGVQNASQFTAWRVAHGIA